MLIWSGLGWTVPVFWAFISWLFADVFDWRDDGYMIAMFPTAIFSYIFGKMVNANVGSYDEDYGHTFFFIRMQYWGGVCFCIGVLGLILG